jgi:hypothetical protein
MTRDEELIQTFEVKTQAILDKAQQFLTATLPGGTGVFAYVVVSNLVGKFLGNTKAYVENSLNRPVTIPDFIYVEPLDEELEEFFEEQRFKTLREEFPESYEDFSNDDWLTMRRYYKPLYYALYFRDPFMTEMFSSEIQSQNYKRIIQDFELLPLYKKTLDSVNSAPKQSALWNAVNGILKGTINEIWSKDYAGQLFEEAKSKPEVAQIIDQIKTKVGEKVDLEQVKQWVGIAKNLATDLRSRSLSPLGQTGFETSLRAVEYIANISSEGQIQQILIPEKVLRNVQLKPDAKLRVFILQE